MASQRREYLDSSYPQTEPLLGSFCCDFTELADTLEQLAEAGLIVVTLDPAEDQPRYTTQKHVESERITAMEMTA